MSDANSVVARRPSQDNDDSLERIVYGACLVISVAWFVALVMYIRWRPQNFWRMWPHEVGNVVSGWAAPLAALWVFATVFLQRTQLKVQRLELTRSVERLEESAIASKLAQLSKRMMHGVLRVVRMGESPEVYLTRQVEKEELPRILCGHSRYNDLFKANEPKRALELLGTGLIALKGRLTDNWVLHADVTTVEEFCLELTSLSKLVLEIEELASRLSPSAGNYEIPDKSVLIEFRQHTDDTSKLLSQMLHGLRDFDIAEETRMNAAESH